MTLEEAMANDAIAPPLRSDGRRFLRYGLAILLLLLVFVAAAAWYVWPSTYEAYTLLRVRHQPMVLFRNYDLMSLPAAMHPIRSPMVIDAALAKPGVSTLPWIANRVPTRTEGHWLSQQIRVRSFQIGDEELLKISMKGDDPRQLKVLVDAVTEAYLEKVIGEKRRQLWKPLELLEASAARKSADVMRRRELVVQAATGLGTDDAAVAQSKRELLVQHIQRLHEEHSRVQSLVAQKQRMLERFDLQNRAAAEPQGVEKQRDALAQELKDLKAKEAALLDTCKVQDALLKEFETATEEVELRKEDLAAVERSLNMLLGKLWEFDLYMSSPERVTLLQKATVRRLPYREL